MTFISYAQNFEDVLLWRALRDVGQGFYIDVGAWHPDNDSVTRAFYDRGWRGINIEPVADFYRRLAAARPRDVNLHVAAGAAEGEAELTVVEGTGLSTLHPDVLARAGAPPGRTRTQKVPVQTLATICRRHAPGPIHFLKIDVEGAERAVLEGADFAAFRPWIVLVEATAPMSTVETHAEWEPVLTAAAYRFVWFDGLNRFYVAAEHHAALAPHFRTPPNVFDDFLREADSVWAARAAAAETAVAELRERIVTAETVATELRGRVGAAERETQAKANALSAERSLAERRAQEAGALRILLAQQDARIEEQLSLAAQNATRVERATREAEGWVAAMRASTSWRITAPLRVAARVLGAHGRSAEASTPDAPAPSGPASPETAAPVRPDVQPVPAPAPIGIQAGVPAAVQPGTPLRVVHQFHAGSAVGDAITNAMLLVRRLLRDLGFASDIFVVHRDPGLADELRLAEELPQHAGYVLIVHHSMGFDGFERIAALPAPKVLLYHNITPPELLPPDSITQDYARLGRVQLGAFRPLVRAALADSEYNAIELRDLGFDPVRACTLLFDLAALRARVTSPASRPAGAPFTLLFVGRLIESKDQLGLIAAYTAFRARFAQPARLVLVGRSNHPAYSAALCEAIDAAGLGGEVVLAGLVSDEALHAWYAAADLYVSLSGHEGFGVPLVEAMAHGVPVLAWPSGAVPYTLGGAAALLTGRDPRSVAATILDLAADPARRRALVERQHQALDRFALERQRPILLEALARAGAVPPESAAVRALLAANLHISVTGHVRGSYSLARINRALALTLEAHAPGRVRLLPVPGEADPGVLPDDEQAAVARLIDRPAPPSGPVVVISQHYPVLVPEEPGDAAFAFFFWEESLVPPDTVAVLNRGFRGVLAPSHFVAKALIDSGVALPVRVIGHAPPLHGFARPHEAPRKAERPFTFLHVSSCFPRKGVDVLLAAYTRAFRRGDAVRLVIKGFPNPHNDAAEQIARLRAADPEAPAIELIDRDLDEAALAALYAEADAMVLPTRGEGFNLPAAEAMAGGVPLIVTGFGGHMDFCDEQTARLVRFRLAPSGSHLASPHSLWAEPDAADLAAALREAADPSCRPAMRARAVRAARRIAVLGADVADQVIAAALDALLAPPTEPLRLGWVSSWDVRCGVAEYSRHLLDALSADGAFASIRVFADARTACAAPGSGPEVEACWRLGEAETMPALATAIAAADPQVLVFQHQPGLIRWASLATLLAMPALAGRTIAVTLHNTRNLLDVPQAECDAAVAALGRITRVLVHTLADLHLLDSLGLHDNVTLLPHGTAPPREAPPVRTLPPHAAPLIGCYGFFLPGKGIPQLIAALAQLRTTWPAARLRLVNASYDIPESEAEIEACRAQAEALALADAVQWETGFLPHARSLDLLAECDVIALPYQSSKEASSAALRTALAAGVPVLVTPLPLFDEAEDAVFRATGTETAAVAEALARLLAEPALRDRVRTAAHAWLQARSWEAVATRLSGMLRGLHARGRGMKKASRQRDAAREACEDIAPIQKAPPPVKQGAELLHVSFAAGPPGA